MATLSSFKDSLQGLGNRLKAENEAHSRDRMNTNLNLDFSRERPGSERRPRPSHFADFQIPGRPNTISARPKGERPRIEPLLFQAPKQNQDSPELNAQIAHVKEISRNKGIITINSRKYKSTIDDMKYISELGNGTSGSVVKMLHIPSEKYIAVKQMHRSGNLEEAKRVFFDLEVVLNSHDCPYIVQCLGCFVTDTDVWICMELMATCLDKLMKKYKQPFPEPIIGKIAVGTVKALHYLKESHGVIHRDVKPSNILLDEKGNIKLCDFGISGRLVESKANTRSAGCAAYMAPERIDPPDPSKPDYDIRADVWSLGITLVELATGQFPYKDCRTDFEVLTKVLQDNPPTIPDDDKSFSAEFKEFVKDCLAKDYKKRPKYKKLLEYSFIKKYEKEKIDVSKWFKEVTRTIENRSKTWPQTIFSSPQFPRPSRISSRAPSSAPANETPPTPPPVAPRRRSRTPDTRSQERFNNLPPGPPGPPGFPKGVPPQGPHYSQNHHHHPQLHPQSSHSRQQPSPQPPPHPNRAPPSNHVRPQVPAPSTSGRAVSASPARHIPALASPTLSRALSASPIPRGGPNDLPPTSSSSSSSHFYATPPNPHSHFLASHLSGSVPHHQYGVPSTSPATSHAHHTYGAKSFSQGYSQYCNPYSQALPPRPHPATSYSSAHPPVSSQASNTSSGTYSTSVGENYVGNVKSSHPRFHPVSVSSSSSNSSSSSTTSAAAAAASSSHPTSVSCSCSSSSSTSLTHQILRKTPEPVRFNPEPWAPRGRFTQPAHHHFRSLSHDFSSTTSPPTSISRYPSYLPPHVSPLVSRRIVESKGGAGEKNYPHPSSSSGSSAPSSLPAAFSSPHYRYTQEAYYNSRPYYTPELQRRIFPRIGHP